MASALAHMYAPLSLAVPMHPCLLRFLGVLAWFLVCLLLVLCFFAFACAGCFVWCFVFGVLLLGLPLVFFLFCSFPLLVDLGSCLFALKAKIVDYKEEARV